MWFSKLKEGEDCCDVPRDLMVNIENTGRQDKVLHLTRGGLARKSGFLDINCMSIEADWPGSQVICN